MQKQLINVLLVLLCSSILTACEADKDKPLPVTEVPVAVIVKPKIQPENLVCMDEPAVGQIVTDVQLGQLLERTRVAGQDCRTKLGAVRKALQ